MGNLLCAVLVWVWLIACFFIHLSGSLCVGGQCVTWLMPVGIGERKCENTLGDNGNILGICVNYYGRIRWIFCSYLCLVLLFWLGCVPSWWYCVLFSLMCIITLSRVV